MSEIIEVKAADLIGPTLDWAVATVEGMPIKHDPMGFGRTENGGYWVWGDSLSGPMLKIGSASKMGYSPSTDWSYGGPLIEKHRVSLIYSFEQYEALIGMTGGEQDESPLIAACRAIVAAKFGDTVHVPKELMP